MIKFGGSIQNRRRRKSRLEVFYKAVDEDEIRTELHGSVV